MPTDTPAAAALPLVADLAESICYALCRDDEQFKRIARDTIEAKLAPVLDAMTNGDGGRCHCGICLTHKDDYAAVLLSLSPQPPEAPR